MSKAWKLSVAVAALLAATISPASAQALEQGRRAYQERDYVAAFRALEPLSHGGNPEAQYLIGRMFLNGYMVPKDPIEAAALFRRAGDQGHAEAQFALAGLLSAGLGVARDEAQATRWNLKAANQGHVEAQLQMGYRYDLGEGVPIDRREAARWYLLAAEQGAVDPNLGMAYCAGIGVEQDPVAGHFWLMVYLTAHPDDGVVREVLADCRSEMSPEEIESTDARFAEWRIAQRPR